MTPLRCPFIIFAFMMLKKKNTLGAIPHFSIILLLIILVACGGRQSQSVSQEQTTADTMEVKAPTPPPDTIKPQEIPTPPVTDPSPTPSPTTRKACEPAFILVSHPEKNTHLYQVKDFNPEDFQCWTTLETHARKECGESMPCRVIYVEASAITPTTIAPDYVDKAVLAKKGIGRYEYTNAWWEIRGAKIWGRTGKGFDYYNSNRY